MLREAGAASRPEGLVVLPDLDSGHVGVVASSGAQDQSRIGASAAILCPADLCLRFQPAKIVKTSVDMLGEYLRAVQNCFRVSLFDSALPRITSLFDTGKRDNYPNMRRPSEDRRARPASVHFPPMVDLDLFRVVQVLPSSAAPVQAAEEVSRDMARIFGSTCDL